MIILARGNPALKDLILILLGQAYGHMLRSLWLGCFFVAMNLLEGSSLVCVNVVHKHAYLVPFHNV